MENDILDSLNDLCYDGPLSDEVALSKALEGGPKSLEFAKLVHVLAAELKKLCNVEETVNVMNNADEWSSFILELSSFLKELKCPYKNLTTGHMSSRLQTKEDRILLLDYLISELMAARMVTVDCPKEKNGSGMEIVMQESPAAKDLKEILIALKFNKPPPNITPEMLFSKLEAKLKETLQKEGDQLVGKPLYNKSISEKEWKQLENSFTEMFEEYRLRRETLVTRLECTIQSFEWSDRLKSKKDHIQSAYRPKRDQMKVKPDVRLSDFLAARTSLLQVEKTSSASVRKNTQSDVNKVIIGQVPDRGGRPSEQQPPPPEMPSWQQRSTPQVDTNLQSAQLRKSQQTAGPLKRALADEEERSDGFKVAKVNPQYASSLHLKDSNRPIALSGNNVAGISPVTSEPFKDQNMPKTGSQISTPKANQSNVVGISLAVSRPYINSNMPKTVPQVSKDKIKPQISKANQSTVVGVSPAASQTFKSKNMPKTRPQISTAKTYQSNVAGISPAVSESFNRPNMPKSAPQISRRKAKHSNIAGISTANKYNEDGISLAASGPYIDPNMPKTAPQILMPKANQSNAAGILAAASQTFESEYMPKTRPRISTPKTNESNAAGISLAVSGPFIGQNIPKTVPQISTPGNQSNYIHSLRGPPQVVAGYGPRCGLGPSRALNANLGTHRALKSCDRGHSRDMPRGSPVQGLSGPDATIGNVTAIRSTRADNPKSQKESDETTNDPIGPCNTGSTGTKIAFVHDQHPAETLGLDIVGPLQKAIIESALALPDPLPKFYMGNNIQAGVFHVMVHEDDAVSWLCGLNGITVKDVKIKVTLAKDLFRPVKMAWKSRQTGATDIQSHPVTTSKDLKGPGKKAKFLCGSARRRRAFWVQHGLDKKEAEARCSRPLADFPEYHEIRAAAEVEEHQNKKRPRLSESSPGGQPSKKARISGPSFAEFAGSTRVGILDSGRPITAEMATMVEDEIARLVDLESGGGPRFVGFTIRGGVIILTCLNGATRKWLEDRMEQLQPWDGAALRLVNEKDLPKPVVVMAFLPGTIVDSKTILRRLHVQNEEVGCDRWRVINTRTESAGQTVCFGLDSLLLPNLLRKNSALHLGMRVIHFRVKGPKNESREGSGSGTVGGEEAAGCFSIPPPEASASAEPLPTIDPEPQPGTSRGAVSEVEVTPPHIHPSEKYRV